MCVREPHVPLHVLTLSSLQSWDTELEAFAQAYAEKCIWDHNKERGRRGENLFAMAPMLDLEFAVEDWNAEEKFYNLTTSTCVSGQMCGHYTQVPTCWGRGEVWWGRSCVRAPGPPRVFAKRWGICAGHQPGITDTGGPGHSAFWIRHLLK